ncbi:hypothetical protein M0R72_06535 [Candidatus Pacearchaeota archaeon]|jgi:hypothetical protein|nr:hypothetical protein [Candidatus Pacearchaeota archaeon]
MTYAIKDSAGNRVIVVEKMPRRRCELCGKTAELRPYGPNGENICFACGMKDEETTAKQFGKIILGENLDS